MKIVVLDGRTLNPGDLSWALLETLGEVQVYDRSTPEEIVERCRDAEALLTNKAVLSRETLSRLSKLRYVGVTATGFNIVDVEACRELGITVCNAPAYSTMSVAQLVFAFILEHCHHVGLHSELVRQGCWSHSPDFAFWEKPLVELDGLTLGIVGFGNIGRQVARLGNAFGMEVLVHSRTRREEPGVEWTDLENLLHRSDFVTLHCPLTDQTQGMINTQSVRQMKQGAFLINTGRGPLVVEQDLADALNDGYLSGAGLDVLSMEPPPADNPLLRAKNALVTPHIAWATRAARVRLMKVTVENLAAWTRGEPQNRVA
jgi:glycerate dehydrogenase